MLQPILLLLCQLYCCHGYHYGPPPTEHVCREMFPEGHHVDAQPGENPPFEIDLSQNVYTPWEEVEVKLRATDGLHFRGFFMQVRRANCSHPYKDEALGMFTVFPEDQELLKTMPCLNNRDSAISHRVNKTFNAVKFRWNAPAARMGHLYFRATVVRQQDIFWTNVKSHFMRDLDQSHAIAQYCNVRRQIEPGEVNTTPSPPTSSQKQELTTSGCNHCRYSYTVVWLFYVFSAILLSNIV